MLVNLKSFFCYSWYLSFNFIWFWGSSTCRSSFMPDIWLMRAPTRLCCSSFLFTIQLDKDFDQEQCYFLLNWNLSLNCLWKRAWSRGICRISSKTKLLNFLVCLVACLFVIHFVINSALFLNITLNCNNFLRQFEVKEHGVGGKEFL